MGGSVEIDVLRRYERDVLETIGRLRSIMRDAVNSVNLPVYRLGVAAFADAEELAEWLRWRVTEGWVPPTEPAYSHFDDLVRVLAGEILDLFDLWVGESGNYEDDEGV